MKKIKKTRNYFGLNFIATGNDTNGRYFLSQTIIPAGDSGPPIHSHSNEDESFFLKNGQLKFIVNDEEIELNTGEFLNIESGERHAWKNESNEDAELIVTFAPAGIENMFIELDKDMSRIKEIGMKYGTLFEI